VFFRFGFSWVFIWLVVVADGNDDVYGALGFLFLSWWIDFLAFAFFDDTWICCVLCFSSSLLSSWLTSFFTQLVLLLLN